MTAARPVGIVGLVLLITSATNASQRGLTFEQRVDAQAAIERVYYSHQTAASRPFEQAAPRAVLEAKVDRTLRQSAALERFWRTPLTAAMLERELSRMVRQTQQPDRLRELFAALGNDTFLIQETLVRQALVERLTRNFFSFDRSIHARARAEAEEIRQMLVAGRLDPYRDHPRRSTSDHAARAEGGPRGERGLDPERREGWRRQFPTAIGEIGAVSEEREAYVVRVLLDDTPGHERGATYSVPKQSWNDWWLTASGEVDPRSVAGVAAELDPRQLETAASCPYDVWSPLHPGDAPSPRTEHTAVWTGSEMIIWGGRDGGGSLATGGRYDPATDTWTPVEKTGAPSPRWLHTAVWTGTEMIVWGGTDGTALATGGRYDPVLDSWTPISMVGAPAARSGHAAEFVGSRMVVWGGGGSNTGGRYDPATDTWAATATIGAPPSDYDDVRAVSTGSEMLVVTGTSRCVEQLGDYSCDGRMGGARYDPLEDSWTPVSHVPGPPRRGFTLVWTGSKAILWGGYECDIMAGCSSWVTLTGAVYDLASDTWTPTSQADAPWPNAALTAIWTGSRMLVGGTTGAYDPASDTWTVVSLPYVGGGHTSVWTGTLMILWGGGYPSYATNSGFRYDPATDQSTPTLLSPGAPEARASHAAVWTGSHMLVWGGFKDSYVTLATGALYDPATATWTDTATTGAPEARSDFASVWTGDRLIVWGGLSNYPSTAPLNTGGIYDPILDQWSPTPTSQAPAARYIPTAVWTGTEMIVWGGITNDMTNTGGRYDPALDRWRSTRLQGAPAARSLHTAAWTGSKMFVWGGFNGDSSGGLYDPVSDSWSPTSLVNAPPWRPGPAAVWSGDRVIVWGGDNRTTGGRYDPVADSWTPTSTAGAPPTGFVTGAVWTGTEMLTWGYAAQGGRYDPATNTWTPTSRHGAPEGREAPLVWTGDTMIVWGGEYGGNSGGVYGLPPETEFDDADADGVGDTCDNCPSVPNSDQLDSDTDAKGDVCDPCPLSRYDDVDLDGLCGNLDNCPIVSNADQLDGDADGRGNPCDNCPTVSNPTQDNSDGDATGNACDPCPVSNPDDIDVDGICTNVDNCPVVANPSQTESDGDGYGDVCDNCPTLSNSTQGDSDSDGVGDVCDNCPSTSNPDQSDLDGDGDGHVCDNCPDDSNPNQLDSDFDGVGDVCDECPFGFVDADLDGVCNQADNCPFVTNADQLDGDADGAGDPCDNCPGEANPTQLDADGDGSGNACDACPFSAPPDDPDGDGLCDDEDNCPGVANAGQLDADGDDAGDACDNCLTVVNRSQHDLDERGQWAASAVASSEWSSDEWAAADAAGAPESAGICTDVPTNWSPATGDAAPEWIELSYAVPVHAASVHVHETLLSGFVTGIELIEPGGTVHALPTEPDTTTCGSALVRTVATTPYLVSAVRVRTQIEGYEEIDAVQLVSAFTDGVGDACDTCPGILDPEQSDNDGDGRGDLCDCAPSNPLVRTPDEPVLTATKTAPTVIRLDWSWPLGADAFNVTRGRTDQLPASDYGACMAPALAAQSLEDPELPVVGSALMYLVQPVSSACGAGSLGRQSNGAERVNGSPWSCP